MEKAIHERHRPLQKIFPSAKLGNNMTPIKGRLGKNTTPTSGNPVKMSQLQTNLQQRRSSFGIPSHANLIHPLGKEESPKYGIQSNKTAIYKEAKELGNSCNRSKFSVLMTFVPFRELKGIRQHEMV